MGKQRKQRQKFHVAAPKVDGVPSPTTPFPTKVDCKPIAMMEHSGNLFEGLKIDFGSLNKSLSDDTRSIKSSKSEAGKTPSISKKDKLKNRRETFLKKLDTVAQVKKLEKSRAKRRKTPIIGDANPLRDALPSLESLLKNRPNLSFKQPSQSQAKKRKGIEKVSKQKKTHIQGIDMFRQILKNKQFQKDPHGAISQHVEHMVSQEKSNSK